MQDYLKKRKALFSYFYSDSGRQLLDEIAKLCEVGQDIYSKDTLTMARSTGKQSVYYNIIKIMETKIDDDRDE
jgi:hypothetical protein